MNLLLRWALGALALYLTTLLNVGLYFEPLTLSAVLVTALVLGLVNAVVRPVMIFLTLPLTLLTLGLFLLVVNALAVGIVAALTPLNVTGFGGAVVGALLLSIINALLSHLFAGEQKA